MIYLNVKKVAKIFRRHPRTIRRWIHEGYIQAIRKYDGWQIPNTEVERILKDASSYDSADI